MSFVFETQDVDVDTSIWIRERLAEGRGGWVVGGMGTGKSHAVRAAIQGGIRVDVAAGPLFSQRFAADLACQLGVEGKCVLDAFRHRGLNAALEIAGLAINGHPLVVDGADRLLGSVWSLDEPEKALWQEEKTAVLEWAQDRMEHFPTILVGRRCPRDMTNRYQHRVPEQSPIKLERAHDGFQKWLALAQRAKGNPAVLTLARALVPLLPASKFNVLVDHAEEDETSVDLLQRLGRAFQSCAPPFWQKMLALLAAVGEVPQSIMDPVLRGLASRNPASREPASFADLEFVSALKRLQELKLVEQRTRGLAVLPALADSGAIRPLTSQERSELLPAVAHQLLAPINDLRSLEPSDADHVLRAHSIFVELGDMANAERTAALHVHGLIELARSTSRNERYMEAWQQYDGLLRMMQSGTWGLEDRTSRRLLSYVRHYRAYNGVQARALDDAAVVDEYQAALAEWPENALWNQRVTQSLIRLGRLVDARRAVEKAYQCVDEHPRRDELLRVRPARTALQSGALLLSLELIEPVLDAPADLYPAVADERDALLQRWAQGIRLSELPFPAEGNVAAGCLVFLRQTEISLRRTESDWVARLDDLAREGRAERPLAALENIARQLSQDAYRLISTPSSHLGAKDVRFKGSLLSVVDALNSDIGFDHDAERWLVGRIDGGQLIPIMRALPPVQIPASLLPETTQGLYFARVPIYRDGVPSGPASAMKPAGSGRSLDDLLDLLARMSESAA